MPAFSLAVMIGLVAVMGTVGGAATRYERYGPAGQRGPAGALAVISLSLAVTIALTAFGVATLQTDGVAWRLLGAACAGGIFGGMVAARGVDHYLVLASRRQALAALAQDARSGMRAIQELLAPLPWQSVADALAGARIDVSKPERLEPARR
ncbi:MAG: hypothetical protein WKF47_03975 [Geodermatophilaceae bacterium]